MSTSGALIKQGKHSDGNDSVVNHHFPGNRYRSRGATMKRLAVWSVITAASVFSPAGGLLFAKGGWRTFFEWSLIRPFAQ